MASGEPHEPFDGSTSTERRRGVPPDQAASDDVFSGLSSRIQPILSKLEALGQDTIELVDIQIDRARSGVRRGGETVVIGAWAGLVGITASVVAAILLVRGLAGALAALFGDRVWLGDLVAALLVIAGTAVALFVWRSARARKALQRQKVKHALKHNGQSPDTPHN